MNSRATLPIVLLSLTALPVTAEELPLELWLHAETGVAAPPFEGDSFSLDEHLAIDAEELWPAVGDALSWPGGDLTWTERRAPGGELGRAVERPTLSVLLAYLEVPRWSKATLELETELDKEIYLDGESLGSANETPLTLTRGRHRLLLVCLEVPGGEPHLGVKLRIDDAFAEYAPSVTTDPEHMLTQSEAQELRSAGALTMVDVAPDGSTVAVLDGEGALELHGVPDGTLRRSVTLPGRITSFSFSPDGRALAVATANKEEHALRIARLDGNPLERLSAFGK